MKKTLLRITILLTVFLVLFVVIYGLCYLAKEYNTPRVYENSVIRYSFAYEVDANLVYAVIKAESGFDRKAVSKKGAEGLMQLTRTTSHYVAQKLGENFEGADLFDADTNIRYGVWYLSYLFKKFDNLDFAILAYNAGEGNVRKWIADGTIADDEFSNVPFPETKTYRERVLKYYNLYRRDYYY